jgi:hypothetical protein
VGADGQVLTVDHLLTGDSALVQIAGAERPARLLQRLPALGLVLLGVEGEGPLRCPPARLEPAASGEWVVSVGAGHRPSSAASPALRAGRGSRSPCSCAAGSPVLDGRGRLLGIATSRRRSGTRVAALPAVRQQLQDKGGGL